MNEKEFAFLWDIDGVVADSPHEKAWREVAEMPEWGITGVTPEFYQNYVASRPRTEGAENILSMLGGFEKLGADTPEKKKELLDKYSSQKNRIIVDLITKDGFGVFESSVMMIVEAKARGIRLAAVSASKNANTMLKKINVNSIVQKNNPGAGYGFIKNDTAVYDLFDVNLSGKTVPGGKAELLKISAGKISDITHGEAKKFVVFEDGISGIEYAKQNGFFAVGIIRIGTRQDFEKAGADIIVNDLSETSCDEILKQLAGRGAGPE